MTTSPPNEYARSSGKTGLQPEPLCCPPNAVAALPNRDARRESEGEAVAQIYSPQCQESDLYSSSMANPPTRGRSRQEAVKHQLKRYDPVQFAYLHLLFKWLLVTQPRKRHRTPRWSSSSGSALLLISLPPYGDESTYRDRRRATWKSPAGVAPFKPRLPLWTLRSPLLKQFLLSDPP